MSWRTRSVFTQKKSSLQIPFVKHVLTIHADVSTVMSTSRKVVPEGNVSVWADRMLKSCPCQNAVTLPFTIDGTVVFIPLLAWYSISPINRYDSYAIFPLNRYNCYSTYSLYPYDYYPNSPILRCLPLTVSQNLDIMHIGFALGEGKVNRLLGTLNSNSMIPGVQTDYHSSVPYILRISRTFVLCVYK